MKKIILPTILCSFLLINCNKNTQTEKKSEEISPALPAHFKVDSVQVKDSIALTDSLILHYNKVVLSFEGIENKALLDSIYSQEKIRAANYSPAELKKAITADKENFYAENKESLKEWTPDFKQSWNKNSHMKILSEQNGYLTLKYYGDGFTGGAHGYYYEFYKVFDLEKNKTLQLADVLISQNADIWDRILMDNFLKNDLELGQSKMLLVKRIPLTRNFYFDNNNLYFLYNQYEIAAYAAGPVRIKVPFSDIKPILTAEIKNRLALK